MTFAERVVRERWFFPNASEFFEKIVYHPCARPWYVWVQAGVVAYIELAALVTIPFWDDLARMGGEHLVGEGKRRRAVKKHGRKVVAVEKPTKREKYYAKGLNTLLVITQPLETIGFAYLLWAAGDHFFYRFASLLDQSAYCVAAFNSGPLSRNSSGGMVAHPAGPTAMPLPNLEQDRGLWGSTPFTATLPIGRFFAAFAITITGPAGGPSDWEAQLHVTQAGLTKIYRGGKVTAQTGEDIDLLVSAEFILVSIFGGTMQWRLDGPGVPIGIAMKRAHMIVWRRDA